MSRECAMSRPHKVYYMIHQGEEVSSLYAIYLILDSARALFDKLTENEKLNGHLTLSAFSVNQHGVITEKKLLFSYKRKMGFTVDLSCI